MKNFNKKSMMMHINIDNVLRCHLLNYKDIKLIL